MRKEPRAVTGLRHVPGLLICGIWCVFLFVIFGYILGASLSTTRDIFMGTVFKYQTGLHWENYVQAWSRQKLYVNFLNSMLYGTLGVGLGLAISTPAAYVLARYRFFGNELIKRFLLITLSIPGTMVMFPLVSLFYKFDIQGRVSLIIVYACLRVPFTTIFLTNFFEGVSRTYEEAAAIDGCPNRKIFSKIALPMVIPAVATSSLFGFIEIMNEMFLCSILLPSNSNGGTLGQGLMYAIKQLQFMGNYAAVYSSVVIVVMPSILIYAFVARKIIFGGLSGGIKG